jgi:hypothetical protein
MLRNSHHGKGENAINIRYLIRGGGSVRRSAVIIFMNQEVNLSMFLQSTNQAAKPLQKETTAAVEATARR